MKYKLNDLLTSQGMFGPIEGVVTEIRSNSKGTFYLLAYEDADQQDRLVSEEHITGRATNV